MATLQPILLPNAGREASDWLGEQLAGRGIAFHTGRKVERVEAGRVVFEDGDLEFDLLVGIPPHRAPEVVRSSALTGESGWVKVDPGTLATDFEGVFAIGDLTAIKLANDLPLPKAGIMAEAHGTRVAAAIDADVRGEPAPPPFDGRGHCFMETSKTTAALIEGEFYAEPAPRVALQEISEAHAEAKHQFERERLEKWFGA